MSDFDNECPEYSNEKKFVLMTAIHHTAVIQKDGDHLLTFFWTITSICILVITLVLYSLAKAILLRQNNAFFVFFFSVILLGLSCLIATLWVTHHLLQMVSSKGFWNPNFKEGLYYMPSIALIMMAATSIFTFNLV